MALSAVRHEGYGIVGFYVKHEPTEIVHFADPPQSRTGMCGLVNDWLTILQDNSVEAELVESGPNITITDA